VRCRSCFRGDQVWTCSIHLHLRATVREILHRTAATNGSVAEHEAICRSVGRSPHCRSRPCLRSVVHALQCPLGVPVVVGHGCGFAAWAARARSCCDGHYSPSDTGDGPKLQALLFALRDPGFHQNRKLIEPQRTRALKRCTFAFRWDRFLPPASAAKMTRKVSLVMAEVPPLAKSQYCPR